MIYIYIYIYIYIHIHTHTHTHNGILLSHKNGWNVAICINMDGPKEYHTKWNKSDRERQILFYTTYICTLKYNKQSYIQNRNRLPDIENKHGYQREKGVGKE